MRRDRMVVSGLLMAGALAAAGPAVAQEAVDGHRAWGTLQIGPSYVAGWNGVMLLEIGGGAEVVWPNGFGFSVDFTLLGSAENFEPGAALISPALIYEFPTQRKLRPYLRGGITLANFVVPMVDLGGGVNYWLTERFGLKGEFRHSLFFEDPALRLTSVRAGVNIRF